ncbi:ABC transporter ATP-binding protein [Phormidium pseudopriestleyi FRX01]|uniref:ABC transporter ATP-binding protein n=1 Tax=Phormidium pseudopriestleyi FRX01 TaxID=1759528 RepID=A0ABS3FU58_9CYAN|nr:ABC transporter ATP-binding protein [Phormidium pseudopriestleyi]MBO0350646.1 ABC transporter ATP-binding protein [Phormidium pseudopriestleyi FRX01]
MKFFQKLLYLFTTKERWQIAGLFILILIGAGLETLGIGLVLPLISLLENPQLLQEEGILGWVYQVFGATEPRYFLIGAGLGLIGIYLVKNAYLTGLTYLQCRFIYNKQVELCFRLFRAYLYSPYTFHLQRNSAELIRNLSSETKIVCGSVLTPGLLALTEITILTCLALLLFLMDPVTCLMASGLIGLATVSFYQFVRIKLSQLGNARQYHQVQEIQTINQAFGGVKEAKVLGREQFFLEVYRQHNSASNRTLQYFQIVSQLPRLFIETIAVVGLMLIFVSVLVQGRELSEVIPTLSLFAAAAFRLMPSINRILNSVTTIRFSSYAVNVIYHDLRELQPLLESSQLVNFTSKLADTKPVLETFIELRNVFYRYPAASDNALKGVSLTIPKGTSVGFVGSSGAGKTTIVDVILGLLPPTQGQVLVDGRDIYDNLSAWQRLIGYIPQSIYLCDDTLRNNIAFGIPADRINEDGIESAVESAQLTELVKSLPQGLDTLVGERGVRLSGGQRQRVGIARALYHNPEVLVMDEATAALDNQTEAGVMEAVEKLSGEKTLIMIAHRLSTVKNCDRLYFMNQGQIIDSGTYDELCQRNHKFKRMAQVIPAKTN